ncbi:unnamed protein product [Spirodela intermedia]|uniref:Uncharacterized protein n=1 Tax=Spirodela intermedia TaxID=51605 RepID=A0A7I8IY98_SPIIN|nr:unnamed protein product [Spirodela intermedia]CAA6662857.1 unnamed protein product [Spirodela intermedia]
MSTVTLPSRLATRFGATERESHELPRIREDGLPPLLHVGQVHEHSRHPVPPSSWLTLS